MVPEPCRARVHAYFEALAHGQLAAAADGLDPTAAAEFQADFIRFRAALPGYQFSVAQVRVQPARIIVQWTAHGRPQELGQAGAGGEREAADGETVPGILVYRVASAPSVDAECARDRRVVRSHQVGWASHEWVAA